MALRNNRPSFSKSSSVNSAPVPSGQKAIEEFAAMMIERMTQLKNEKWEKGWINSSGLSGLPMNLEGRNYCASNSFFLQLISSQKGYSIPVFLTFNQARKLKAGVIKGEKSFPVIYWDINVKDAMGKKISIAEYRKLDKTEQKDCSVIPFIKSYPVFNIDQTNFAELYPEKFEKLKERYKVPEVKDTLGMYEHPALDRMIELQSWYCPIHAENKSKEAFYSPSSDLIVMPMKEQFNIGKDEESIYRCGMEFYSTLLHEMTHSTMIPERLNREGGIKFGDAKYAREELVAQLTAALLCNSMGFDSKITDNSAKYLDFWIGKLKEEPKFILSVMSDVNKASEMILDKVDEQKIALGENPYLTKNIIAQDEFATIDEELIPFKQISVNEQEIKYGSNVDSDTQTIIENFLRKDEKFRYMMLSRLQMDCDYFLGYDNRDVDQLWAHDTARHIAIMKALHNSFTEKPQWLSMEKILDYENQMTVNKLSEKEDLNKDFIVKEPANEYGNSISDNKKDKMNNPLLAQYYEMKSKHPDAILLFRVGDFYETFKEDAVRTSEILDITLTRRADTKEGSVELAGFPHHALDTYLPKLVKSGARVAICEQLEQPQKKLAKRGVSNENKKELKSSQNNENNMAKKTKNMEPVSEKKEEQEILQMKTEEKPTVFKDIVINVLDKKLEPDSPVMLNVLTKEEPGIIAAQDIRNGKVKEENFILSTDDFKAYKEGEIKLEDLISKHCPQYMDVYNERMNKILNADKVGESIDMGDNKEESVKQRREPQMITVNGDKISHGHAFKGKDENSPWFFVAHINDEKLKPVPMAPGDAEAFMNKELSIEDLMHKYYPTKVMAKVPQESFQLPKGLKGPEKDLQIQKFNVYKEKDENRQDFGTYKFYAVVDGKKMSKPATREQLNEYFDRVQSPSQLVEKAFGDRLGLPGYYNQFSLPEGMNENNIRIEKNQESNRYEVFIDLGKGQKSHAKVINRNDLNAFNAKTATKGQLAAKYIPKEINSYMVSMALKQSQKQEKSVGLKV